MPKLARERKPGGVAGGLRAARAWAWLSLDELASRTGISRSVLSDAENGRSTVTVEHVARVADATGVPAALIVGGLDRVMLSAAD